MTTEISGTQVPMMIQEMLNHSDPALYISLLTTVDDQELFVQGIRALVAHRNQLVTRMPWHHQGGVSTMSIPVTQDRYDALRQELEALKVADAKRVRAGLRSHKGVTYHNGEWFDGVVSYPSVAHLIVGHWDLEDTVYTDEDHAAFLELKNAPKLSDAEPACITTLREMCGSNLISSSDFDEEAVSREEVLRAYDQLLGAL